MSFSANAPRLFINVNKCVPKTLIIISLLVHSRIHFQGESKSLRCQKYISADVPINVPVHVVMYQTELASSCWLYDGLAMVQLRPVREATWRLKQAGIMWGLGFSAFQGMP